MPSYWKKRPRRSIHMVEHYHQFNRLPWDGRLAARQSPNPVAKFSGEPKRSPAMVDLNRLLNALSFRPGVAVEFQRMLEWKLLRGSHEFPGPHGGTCINEAAIVAAGYPYRAVYCVKDMPAAFSRPIAMLALCLNDTLDDDLRQELLMPFVTRLGGSADTPKIEMARAELMLQRTVAEILAPALARAGYGEFAERARTVKTPMELVEIARCLREGGRSMQQPSLLSAFEHAADAAAQWRAGLPTEVVFCTFSAMREIASLDGDCYVETVYRRAAAILDAAIAIGNQAEATNRGVVATRMECAKRAPEAARRDGSLAAA
jgi:hypothetical protein